MPKLGIFDLVLGALKPYALTFCFSFYWFAKAFSVFTLSRIASAIVVSAALLSR
jgi:hypothetical protein